MAPRLVWIAADHLGEAHAQRPGSTRTLCGASGKDPRWAWPERSRCAACELLATNPGVVLAVPERSRP